MSIEHAVVLVLGFGLGALWKHFGTAKLRDELFDMGYVLLLAYKIALDGAMRLRRVREALEAHDTLEAARDAILEATAGVPSRAELDEFRRAHAHLFAVLQEARND